MRTVIRVLKKIGVRLEIRSVHVLQYRETTSLSVGKGRELMNVNRFKQLLKRRQSNRHLGKVYGKSSKEKRARRRRRLELGEKGVLQYPEPTSRSVGKGQGVDECKTISTIAEKKTDQ